MAAAERHVTAVTGHQERRAPSTYFCDAISPTLVQGATLGPLIRILRLEGLILAGSAGYRKPQYALGWLSPSLPWLNRNRRKRMGRICTLTWSNNINTGPKRSPISVMPWIS